MYEYDYDADYADNRLVMVVGQQRFDYNSHQFCKLIPLCYLNGAPANEGDFPNDGEIWWMLTVFTSSLAQPGALLVGRFEPAMVYRELDPTSSRYQVVRESIRQLDPEIGREVLDLPGEAIERIQDLVDGDFTLPISHYPTPQVLLRWRGDVYGPFTATVTSTAPNPSDPHQYDVAFTPSDSEMAIYRLSDDQFQAAVGDYLLLAETPVSTTPTRRSESRDLMDIEHRLLIGPGYDRMLAQNPARLMLESLRQKLNRFARHCLTRRQRQELRHLLDEMEIKGREAENAEEILDTLLSVKQTIERQDVALDAVARALLESGMLGENRIHQAEEAYAQRYVQNRSAELQAEIDQRIVARRDEVEKAETDLRDVQARLANIQARLQQEVRERRTALDTELAMKRQQAEAEIAAEQERLERARTELQHQQEALEGRLELVVAKLRDASDDVINQFLTIAPLLSRTGLVSAPHAIGLSLAAHESNGSTTIGQSAQSERGAGETRGSTSFSLPAFVHSDGTPVEIPMSEREFFDRFRDVVQASGFQYRELDLIRFHLSVKVGVLTVLGGPSGTGKSSLPMLYARALSGDEIDNGRPDCLMVTVNPSWMDVRDLIGHLNTLEGRFFPAESGLFQHLIFAQEEYQSRGASTGIYVTCLDEMNLSQVEHYFSDLMMVLEREGEHRAIQCFSIDAADEACPFRSWSTIKLSPSLRFIGTVNFDETTRVLSDRFLDRTNLIQLSPGTLPTTTRSGSNELARSTGRMVTLVDFESWRGSAILPPDLARQLDAIRPLLQRIGCPISPRVYRAICQFVGSCSPLLTPDKAFDIQIAQRILPKLRRLVTRRQLEAFDELVRVLKDNPVGPFNETLLLLEEVRETAVRASTGQDWLAQD